MQLAESSGADGLARGGKIVVRLARKPDDNVCRQRRIAQRLFCGPAPFENPFHRPWATHRAENAVRTALKRQVKVGTEPIRPTSQHVEQVVVGLGRFEARQPHAELPRHRSQAAQQIKQTRAILGGRQGGRRRAARRRHPIIEPVVPQMNAGQHDLAMVAAHQLPNLVNNFLDRPTFQVRPHMGNDAVAAFHAATVLHLDEGAMPRGEVHQSLGRDVQPEPCQPVGQTAFVGNHFTDAGQLGNLGGRMRREATDHDDLGPGILAIQAANQFAALGLGLARHHTGVHHAKVGRCAGQGTAVAQLKQPLAHPLRLVLIHLAAQGDDPHGGHRSFIQVAAKHA